MKITILGCGSSSGVPTIGCECQTCKSTNPRNRRTRVSVLVESANTRILVDTPPDMREQLLRHNIKTVDAIIYTHAHADHINGIDDTRSINYYNDAPLGIYSDIATIKQIQDRFSYCFLPPKPAETGWYRPCLKPVVVEPPESFTIGDIEIKAFWQTHGQGKSIGLKFGNMAYSTDTNGLSEEILKELNGIGTWIVDCLRYEPAPTHAHLAMTLSWIEQVKPKSAYLTHLNHGFEYEKLLSELPENVFPAYDGLVITS